MVVELSLIFAYLKSFPWMSKKLRCHLRQVVLSGVMEISVLGHKRTFLDVRFTDRASDDMRSIVVFPLGNENQKQERREYKQMNKTGKNIGTAGCKGQNA
jgi:hypothetical protein